MTAATRLVFLDTDTLPPSVTLKPLPFAHTFVGHARTSADAIAERVRDATIVITNKVPMRAETIAAAQNLKMIAVAATGTDHIDLSEARARGIVVSNIRGYAVNTVPEHCFALILALRRNIIAYHQSVLAGRWQEAAQFCYFDYPIADLAGATLGIIGDGALGRATAKLGEAFGMRALYAAKKGTAKPPALYAPFETVLAESDVISLHAPLRAETRGMIGAADFAAMARKPILINTARGGLVDEHALYAALRSGQIAGAGFDVVSQEPPAPDHIMMQIAALPNVILTPHIAWASQEAMQGLADQLMDNIAAFWAGNPRHVVV